MGLVSCQSCGSAGYSKNVTYENYETLLVKSKHGYLQPEIPTGSLATLKRCGILEKTEFENDP